MTTTKTTEPKRFTALQIKTVVKFKSTMVLYNPVLHGDKVPFHAIYGFRPDTKWQWIADIGNPYMALLIGSLLAKRWNIPLDTADLQLE